MPKDDTTHRECATARCDTCSGEWTTRELRRVTIERADGDQEQLHVCQYCVGRIRLAARIFGMPMPKVSS